MVALTAAVLVLQPASGQEPPGPSHLRAWRYGAQGGPGLQTTVYGQAVLADDPRVEIARARIAISGAGAQASGFVFSDDHGQFQVIAPRAASLTITRSGFLPVMLKVAGAASSSSTPMIVRLTPAAAVSGRLIDSAGEPVVSGGIRISRTDNGGAPGSGPVMTTFSNDLGEFRVGGLAAGKYEISSYHDFDEQARIRTNDEDRSARLLLQQAIAENLVPNAPRAIGEPMALSGVTPVEIRAGADVQVTLQQTLSSNREGLRGSGAIAGAIIDAFGDPVDRVRVRAWRTAGSGRLPARQTGAAAITDDRGHFRLFHLPPGAYVVEVLPASQMPPAPALGPVYYPGTSLVGQASLVSVDAGEAANLTIHYVPSPLSSLHGITVNAAGMPMRAVVGLLATSSGNGVRLAARTTQTAADGSFAFSSVAPGGYVVRATVLRADDPRSSLMMTPAEFGLQRVVVDDVNVGPVRLTTSPTAKLLGRIEFEGTPPSLPADFSIRAMSTDPERTPDTSLPLARAAVSPDSDWTFEITGLTGTAVLDLNRAPAGWWPKAIRTPVTLSPGEPFDVGSDTEVVMVLSNASARVTGRVLPNSTILDHPLVIAFSTDEGQWRNGSSYIRHVRASPQDRTFSMHSLPPGEYFLVAMANAENLPEDEELTALLQALAPLSKRVKLFAGDAQGHELTPVALRK
jgi:protocatechuate 3,4-dioxygenase beta subunit